jgi:hypothetical protein
MYLSDMYAPTFNSDVDLTPKAHRLRKGASPKEGWTQVKRSTRRKILPSNDNNESSSPIRKHSKEKRRVARAALSHRDNQDGQFENEKALSV